MNKSEKQEQEQEQEQKEEADILKKAAPPGLSHLETDSFNMTCINDKERSASMAKEYEAEDTIKIPIPGKPGMDFGLVGFMRIKDAAGDYVLDVKMTRDRGCVMYHLTGHPDSEKFLVSLRVKMIQAGMGHIEFRNIMDQIAETMKTYDDIESGKVKLEPGRHPNMTYLDAKEGEEKP